MRSYSGRMSGGSPFRVLLIGETEASRGHIDRLLQDARGPEGNSVEECHTLIQAFDFLQRTDYDVIVIEEQVARRSGCNTLRELRRARNLVPIVFLTGEETPNSPNGPGVSTESTHGSGINGFCLLRKIQCAVCLRRQEAECRKTRRQAAQAFSGCRAERRPGRHDECRRNHRVRESRV